MGTDTFILVTREALLLVLTLSAPVLVAALAVGLLVSILQAATQVQEQTLSATPKIVAVVVVLMVTGLWMLRTIAVFAAAMFELIGDVGHGTGP